MPTQDDTLADIPEHLKRKPDAPKPAQPVKPAPVGPIGKPNHGVANREQWLGDAVNALRPMFVKTGQSVPDKARVSCSWPSSKGLPGKKQAIGECWQPESSGDGHVEIFISPILGDPVKALDVLAHELCHAACPGDGHKGKFPKTAKAIGLIGKMTATTAGPELTERLQRIADNIGPYPHAAITVAVKEGGRKKQKTNLLKVYCDDCGYTMRITRSWIAEAVPACPCGCVPIMTVDK